MHTGKCAERSDTPPTFGVEYHSSRVLPVRIRDFHLKCRAVGAGPSGGGVVVRKLFLRFFPAGKECLEFTDRLEQRSK